MPWLQIEMWFWLLIAAFFGAVIGWAIKGMRAVTEADKLVSERDKAVTELNALKLNQSEPANAAKITELEKALSDERAALAQMKVERAADQSDTVDEVELDDNAAEDEDLLWHKRYLESRVRYLEGRVEELEMGSDGVSRSEATSSHQLSASIDDQDIDIARIKWRNRYLEGRVKYLEEDEKVEADIDQDPTEVDMTNVTVLDRAKAAKDVVGDEVVADDQFDYGGMASDDQVEQIRDGDELATAIEIANQTGSVKASKKKTSTSAKKKPATDDLIIDDDNDPVKAFSEALEASPDYSPADANGKPPTLSKPIEGAKDDLRKIGGVGPKIAKTLNDMGVWHFRQIAAWDDKQIAWVDEKLPFKGRIERDNWLKQAADLANESRSGSAK